MEETSVTKSATQLRAEQRRAKILLKSKDRMKAVTTGETMEREIITTTPKHIQLQEEITTGSTETTEENIQQEGQSNTEISENSDSKPFNNNILQSSLNSSIISPINTSFNELLSPHAEDTENTQPPLLSPNVATTKIIQPNKTTQNTTTQPATTTTTTTTDSTFSAPIKPSTNSLTPSFQTRLLTLFGKRWDRTVATLLAILTGLSMSMKILPASLPIFITIQLGLAVAAAGFREQKKEKVTRTD